MTITQAIGASLLALPFIAMFGFIVREGGWRDAFAVFGATAGFVAVVALGVALIQYGG